ncbi:DEAD-box ATP-dependent RNA helicase [Rhizophlyctis rosea]|nr:DEAD-box ATP-dependent RNA helicase [Rhizophlyctis rosea]
MADTTNNDMDWNPDETPVVAPAADAADATVTEDVDDAEETLPEEEHKNKDFYAMAKRWEEDKEDEELEKELYDEDHRVTAGINFEEYAYIPVRVGGDDAPEPLKRFEDYDWHPTLKENIAKLRYKTPTPIQQYAIPILLEGRDLMGCAQTGKFSSTFPMHNTHQADRHRLLGSGKTAAYLLPIIQKMLKKGKAKLRGDEPELLGGRGSVATPYCLIMAPTRELVGQIFDDVRKLAYKTWIKPCAIYGGAKSRDMLDMLDAGCDILVGSPGKIKDFVGRGRLSLEKIKWLVIDEADRMLDEGFEPDIRQIHADGRIAPIRDVLGHLPEGGKFGLKVYQRRTQTHQDPQIRRLGRDFLGDLLLVTVGTVGRIPKDLNQTVEKVEEHDKREKLLEILYQQEAGATLIFVSTKKMVDTLDDFLYSKKFPVTSIHGGRDQKEREDALSAFRANLKPIMIATDVAARGLDIPNVIHVVNYDMPKTIDDYIHRIGRTARAGNKGYATSFWNDGNQDIAQDLCSVLTDEIPDFLQEFMSAELKEAREKEELKEEDLVAELPDHSGAAANGGEGGGWAAAAEGGGGWAADGNAGGNEASDWGNNADGAGDAGGDWNADAAAGGDDAGGEIGW